MPYERGDVILRGDEALKIPSGFRELTGLKRGLGCCFE